MADDYKKTMNSRVGVGGMQCRCCNDYRGKDKKGLNRVARHILKQNDTKELDGAIKLDGAIFDKFLDLASDLSPENLCCDGEASKTYIAQKLRRIKKEWKALENQVGRKVTEDEVWDIRIKQTTNL